jgi:hypothetical protein
VDQFVESRADLIGFCCTGVDAAAPPLYEVCYFSKDAEITRLRLARIVGQPSDRRPERVEGFGSLQPNKADYLNQIAGFVVSGALPYNRQIFTLSSPCEK